MKVLGIMSGTSLDGLDLALVEFGNLSAQSPKFQLIASETLSYSNEWKEKLSNAPTLSGIALIKLHFEYGKFLGLQAKEFLAKHNFQAELISSHGHTIFHQPKQNGFTFQLGDVSTLAVHAGLPAIGDFRTADVALGGQGAPLVPIGDYELFGEYKACLNFGGIVNISYWDTQIQQMQAFDIAPLNQVSNYLVASLGLNFDEGGKLGAAGKLIPHIFHKMNGLAYYKQSEPKSLGREWVEREFLPLLEEKKYPIEDLLHTFYKHVVQQIVQTIQDKGIEGPILCTGGGAFNKYLIQELGLALNKKAWIHLPEKQIIEFKEAIIFAYLGYKTVRGHKNTLASVTGAKIDSKGGLIADPYNLLNQ